MKIRVIWLGGFLALGLLNFAIFKKEQTLASGETVYLKLAPVDPRSLMQGDYMVLRYEIANQLRGAELEPISGRVIVTLDDHNIATLADPDGTRELEADERYLAYKNRRGAVFGLESFFFQEGKGDELAEAEYAAIRLSPDGGAILVDLVQQP
jgi:uncharacterized membrane-anchored protein